MDGRHANKITDIRGNMYTTRYNEQGMRLRYIRRRVSIIQYRQK